MLIALLVTVVAVAALLVVASLQAPTFRYERRAHIAAPAPRVAALITDFHSWKTWSPWEQLDPALERRYGGAPAGVGATYDWVGKKAGTGRMEITSAAVDADGGAIVIKLDFFKPFKASNIAEFVLAADAGGTDVTWAMFGPRPFMSKLMGVFMDFDKLIGKDFEKGLAALGREATKA